MDIGHVHEQSLDATARLIDGVSPDHLSLPTPCVDWDVRALLTHLVGGNYRGVVHRPASGCHINADWPVPFSTGSRQRAARPYPTIIAVSSPISRAIVA